MNNMIYYILAGLFFSLFISVFLRKIDNPINKKYLWLLTGDDGIRKQITKTQAYEIINHHVVHYYDDGYNHKELKNIISFLKIMLIK